MRATTQLRGKVPGCINMWEFPEIGGYLMLGSL